MKANVNITPASRVDNTRDYAYLGTVWPSHDYGYTYNHGRKSKVGGDCPAVTAVRWLVKALNQDRATKQAEIWHEGTCGRCGRKLTVPSSVAQGFGPECINKI